MWPTLYARFRPERLSVRLVGTKAHFEDLPDVAVDARTGQLLAVGAPARAAAGPSAFVGNGFGPARTVVGDVELAEVALRYAVEHVLRARSRGSLRWLRLRPDLILHPLAEPEGGLTSFEVRGLEQLGAAVGARHTHVWVGRELSDREIRAGAFRPRPLNG